MSIKKRKVKNVVPIGVVVKDLIIWSFTDNEDVIRHNVEELSKAILYSFHLDNFGPTSFGIPDVDNGDEYE